MDTHEKLMLAAAFRVYRETLEDEERREREEDARPSFVAKAAHKVSEYVRAKKDAVLHCVGW